MSCELERLASERHTLTVHSVTNGPTLIADVLKRSNELSDDEFANAKVVGSLASELARCLLVLAHELENVEEIRARTALARLLSSPSNQIFSLALTDRIRRSADAVQAVSVFEELRARAQPEADLELQDRIQLLAAQRLGHFLPHLTYQLIANRVKKETSPFLLHADDPRLSRELASRRGELGSVNLNYLGEEVLGEDDANQRCATYSQLAARDDIDALSLKLSGIDARLDPLTVEANVERLFCTVSKIIRAAHSNTNPPLIYFDMEAYRDLLPTELLLRRLLNADPEQQFGSSRIKFGVAVQAYLPEALGVIERLGQASAERVKQGLFGLRIRLVKGANMKAEQVEASAHGLKYPTFASKLETDAHYKRCLRRLVELAQEGTIQIGVASHNLFDLAYAILLRERTQIGERLQLEMLEGMAGATGRAIANSCGPLLIYAPAVLDEHLTSAVSYLVRRLDENTEDGHFLRDAARMEAKDAAFERQERAFLASLEESWITAPLTFRKQDRNQPVRSGRFNRKNEFWNAVDTDWTRLANHQWIKKHFANAHSLPHVHPILAEEIEAEVHILARGFDPNDPNFSYPIELASKVQVKLAIDHAVQAQQSWSQQAHTDRIALLRRIALLLEENRGLLIAAMALDAAKRPQESDIEVSEAVDFARYYAFIAETTGIEGKPRGTIVVAPPWNFPLAIPLGGVLAALLAGNAVILKPAPETPWVAQLAVRICHEAGVPRGALQFLPCNDEDATHLITDPRVSAVILTGATSTAELFLKLRPKLHLMAETGGKNGAYLSATSDREQAIGHIITSAFGHAGQKCSALSVLVLEREVFFDDDFKRQLLDAAKTLQVGSAWELGSYVTPLIRRPVGALNEILHNGTRYGNWLLKPRLAVHQSNLLSPGILWGVQDGSFPQNTEFFGPILSVICADDFNHGIQILNSTSYGLTAGLFSLRESEQERFVNEVQAGNLYINRPTTGAVVGRQPFGGRKKSCFGPGAKAGGPDYLRQMVIPPPLVESCDLELIRKNYLRARQEHFAKVQAGTPVLGEDNYLRYQTANTLLVIGNLVSELELEASLLARKLCQNEHPIFIITNESAAQWELSKKRVQQLLGPKSKAQVCTGDVTELAALAQALRVDRLRVIGQLPNELFVRAAQLSVTVLRDAVSSSGLFELMHYLVGQSVSFAFHRYGNLKLNSLSKMRGALELGAISSRL